MILSSCQEGGQITLRAVAGVRSSPIPFWGFVTGELVGPAPAWLTRVSPVMAVFPMGSTEPGQGKLLDPLMSTALQFHHPLPRDSGHLLALPPPQRWVCSSKQSPKGETFGGATWMLCCLLCVVPCFNARLLGPIANGR